MRSIRAAVSGRPLTTVVATLALAFLVAAVVKRQAPDFARLPVIAVVRDAAGRPLWQIRLARAAHQIAIDAVGAGPPQAGHVYRLWLVGPKSGHSLGVLPLSGRKVIAEAPFLADRLAGTGELVVTLESLAEPEPTQPRQPIAFRAGFAPVARP